MLQKLLHTILRPYHPWRHISFSELSELYTAQGMRSLAVNMISIFTAIYLYKLGYSVKDIVGFYVVWFVVRPFFDLANGKLIGAIGPKHGMIISNFVHVMYLAGLLTLGAIQIPLALLAFAGSYAYGLHILAVSVDFSKIKHHDHGGKELGYLVIVERVGAVLGPLVGGLLANYVDPRVSVGLAMSILLGSSIPIMLTSEPVRSHQIIRFRGLPYRNHLRDFLVTIPATIENTISIVLWPMYVGIFLLTTNVYATLGFIATLSTLSSLVLSRKIGAMIDARQGRATLRIGSLLNAIVHIGRPFITNVGGVLFVNTLNEPITAMYRMPLTKGYFDAADSIEGYRIAYLTVISAIDSLARAIFWTAIWALLTANVLEPKILLASCFFLAALCSVMIRIERFKALDSGR